MIRLLPIPVLDFLHRLFRYSLFVVGVFATDVTGKIRTIRLDPRRGSRIDYAALAQLSIVSRVSFTLYEQSWPTRGFSRERLIIVDFTSCRALATTTENVIRESCEELRVSRIRSTHRAISLNLSPFLSRWDRE